MSTKMLMAVLGAVTGIVNGLISANFRGFPESSQELWLPGLVFSPAVALGLWRTTRRPLAIFVAAPMTISGWYLGYLFAFSVYMQFEDHYGELAVFPAGFIGGLMGSATLMGGCALFVSSLRSRLPFATTVATGSLLGLLLYPAMELFQPPPYHLWAEYAGLMLFPFWQAGVGACIRYWLDRETPPLESKQDKN